MSRSRQGNYEKSGLDEKRGEKPAESEIQSSASLLTY